MNKRGQAKLWHPASRSKVDATIRVIEQKLGITATDHNYHTKRKWLDWWRK